jgi:phosphate transport system substrate-binding protein
MMIRNDVVGLLVAASLVVVGAAAYLAQAQDAKAPAAAGPMTLQIEGSTTVGPIADEFTEAFKKLHSDITITVKKTGSGDGAAALIDGRCQIATMSRFMKPEEFKKAVDKGIMPVAHAIALDAVCVIVHPSNPLKGLTVQQIRDIYAGKITNWKDLGGADAPIVVISRDTSSGTYECFNHVVMGSEKLAQTVEYVNSNPQAHSRVATTTGAIGYVGLGFVDDQVKALTVNGIVPNKKTITAGQYPISRPLFLFTNGYPQLGSNEYAFCTFYLTEKGQEIIEAKGFVPVTNY